MLRALVVVASCASALWVARPAVSRAAVRRRATSSDDLDEFRLYADDHFNVSGASLKESVQVAGVPPNQGSPGSNLQSLLSEAGSANPLSRALQ